MLLYKFQWPSLTCGLLDKMAVGVIHQLASTEETRSNERTGNDIDQEEDNN